MISSPSPYHDHINGYLGRCFLQTYSVVNQYERNLPEKVTSKRVHLDADLNKQWNTCACGAVALAGQGCLLRDTSAAQSKK